MIWTKKGLDQTKQQSDATNVDIVKLNNQLNTALDDVNNLKSELHSALNDLVSKISDLEKHLEELQYTQPQQGDGKEGDGGDDQFNV